LDRLNTLPEKGGGNSEMYQRPIGVDVTAKWILYYCTNGDVEEYELDDAGKTIGKLVNGVRWFPLLTQNAPGREGEPGAFGR